MRGKYIYFLAWHKKVSLFSFIPDVETHGQSVFFPQPHKLDGDREQAATLL